ncbi:hypothetical protein Pla100_36990 [Neorhodopirellula pilleata]|uniref:Uncharacterized protein n=1 Tax=Neorhodopirellula pilleata TaxID=2714738 RepID=A0A5C6A6X6_9BACT|nr:hypothetical protein Pla100_36990 [Neorhodopirellula pilleata]
MVLPCQETFGPSRLRWLRRSAVLRPLLTSARTIRVTPVAPPFRSSLTHGYACRSPRIRDVNFRCASASPTNGRCRKTALWSQGHSPQHPPASTTFLFVTSQLWRERVPATILCWLTGHIRRLPLHGLSPRRSCLRLVLLLDRSHLVCCPSFKFRFRTGDWLPEGSGTPQVHAHVGRTHGA